MWSNRTLGDVFDQFGHDDKNEFNDDPNPDNSGCLPGCFDPNQTSVAGMTADAAVNAYDFMTRIQNVLTARPEIDVVLISLGGE